jgi:hypothetical protein
MSVSGSSSETLSHPIEIYIYKHATSKDTDTVVTRICEVL